MRGMIDDVDGTVDDQDKAATRLTESLQRTATQLRDREAAAEGETLLARDDLPRNAEAWQRIARSASRVPAQLAQALRERGPGRAGQGRRSTAASSWG